MAVEIPSLVEDAGIALAQRVSSLDRLFVLLHVALDPERGWTCSELALALGLRPFEVALHLRALADERLVAWDGATRAQLSPSPLVRADVASLARLYGERPEVLLGAVGAVPTSGGPSQRG